MFYVGDGSHINAVWIWKVYCIKGRCNAIVCIFTKIWGIAVRTFCFRVVKHCFIQPIDQSATKCLMLHFLRLWCTITFIVLIGQPFTCLFVILNVFYLKIKMFICASRSWNVHATVNTTWTDQTYPNHKLALRHNFQIVLRIWCNPQHTDVNQH